VVANLAFPFLTYWGGNRCPDVPLMNEPTSCSIVASGLATGCDSANFAPVLEIPISPSAGAHREPAAERGAANGGQLIMFSVS
jgi:hypothetical protein